MDLLFSFLPWWAWFIISAIAALVAFKLLGWRAALSVLLVGAGASAYARGRAAGTKAEAAKQDAADDHARVVIHDKKEDVRAIPNTPAGKAERNERFDRWVK